jgi:small-conductance mechanosensitive channel
MRLFFRGVELGTIQLANFEADWAMPTFKIARIALIALGVVIAYPYIPGSDSLAFKGISVFVGVLLSIGSSSVITNTFAGLSMIYRSAFKVGDRVQIDDVTGLVTEIKLQTTQVVTAKNETVVIPNSNIMNANVVNFSQLAREDGLIVHSSVGIGYDVPWRQVEAMLLEAANRTDSLLKDPPPFVLRRKLGDFAIEYEVNAYCAQPERLPLVYSTLHDHILDVFNEAQVQIMSPAYVADPQEPKIAPVQAD